MSKLARLSIEFKRADRSIPRSDFAEKFSNLVLKPWRLASGKIITISNGPPQAYKVSGKHKLISRIFFGLLTVITSPIFLFGMVLVLCSHSHKAAYRDYLSHRVPKPLIPQVSHSLQINADRPIQPIKSPPVQQAINTAPPQVQLVDRPIQPIEAPPVQQAINTAPPQVQLSGEMVEKYAAWIRAKADFSIPDAFIGDQLAENLAACAGRVDEAFLFSPENERMLVARLKQLKEILSHRTTPKEFMHDKLRQVYQTDNPHEATSTLVVQLIHLVQIEASTDFPVAPSKENMGSILHFKNKMRELINIQELIDLENRLRAAEIGEELIAHILSNWDLIGKDIRDNEAVLTHVRKEKIIAKAKEICAENHDRFTEVLNQLKTELERDLPPIEVCVFQKHKDLPKLLLLMPQSKTEIFHHMLCSSLINQQIKNPAAFLGPKDERTILHCLEFNIQAYDDREKTHLVIATILQDLLNQKDLKSVNILRKQIDDIAYVERLKAAGLIGSQIEQFTLLIAAYISQKEKLIATGQEIVKRFVENLTLPKAKKKLEKKVLSVIKLQVNNFLERFVNIKLFESHSLLSSPSDFFLTLFNEEFTSPECMDFIESYVNWAMRAQLEWYIKYGDHFVEEFIQGEDDENQVLGGGVCYALCLRIGNAMLENPTAPLKNIKIGTILPGDRFLQAAYETNLSLHSFWMPPEYLAKKKLEEIPLFCANGKENMILETVNRLIESREPNRIFMLCRTNHATFIRFDPQSNRFCFFEPNFGLVSFTQSPGEGERDLASRMMQCWYDLYQAVYDIDDEDPLLCRQIVKSPA